MRANKRFFNGCLKAAGRRQVIIAHHSKWVILGQGHSNEIHCFPFYVRGRALQLIIIIKTHYFPSTSYYTIVSMSIMLWIMNRGKQWIHNSWSSGSCWQCLFSGKATSYKVFDSKMFWLLVVIVPLSNTWVLQNGCQMWFTLGTWFSSSSDSLSQEYQQICYFLIM